jgi:hypothetical protein
MTGLLQQTSDYINNFRWADAPLSSPIWPFISVAVYLAVIYTIQWHVQTHRNGRSYPVQTLFAYHNLFLSLLSAVMLAGGATVFIRRYQNEGSIKFAFCERTDAPEYTEKGSHGPFYFWSVSRLKAKHAARSVHCGCSSCNSLCRIVMIVICMASAQYIYYLSKYYELVDTVFLALKGKLSGWGGLNVYHHALVVWMAWLWLEHAQSLQHLGLIFNTTVHVVVRQAKKRRDEIDGSI